MLHVLVVIMDLCACYQIQSVILFDLAVWMTWMVDDFGQAVFRSDGAAEYIGITGLRQNNSQVSTSFSVYLGL
jgi:hypothetical protein